MIHTNYTLGIGIMETGCEAHKLVLEEFQMEDRKVGTLKHLETSLALARSQRFDTFGFEVKGGKVTVYPPEHDEAQAGQGLVAS